MTNYNDGKWHGWNGGECPVHPKTVVEIMTIHGPDRGRAVDVEPWSCEPCEVPIVAFRVIEEYNGPREFWISPESGRVFTSPVPNYIHVREVIE